MSFENKVGKLKRVIENCGGVDKFMANMLPKLLYAKEGEQPLMKPEDFSIREIYEAVNTTQFPIITGTLISKKVMQTFREFDGIADQLVTPVPSSLKIDKIPGLWLKGDLEDIPEGGPYPHAGDMEEEYVQVEGKKRGMILDITEEMVKFDQTGLVLLRAARMSNKLAKDREKKVLYTVQDATVGGVNYYAWYPGGTRTALYYATNRQSSGVAGGVVYANQITDALENYTDLDAVDALMALMKDSNGDHVNVVPTILLVSRALRSLAENLINQQKIPYLSSSSVGYHQDNPYYKKFKVLSSPLIDDVSSNDWYSGDFKRQFIEKVVFPLQVLTRRTKDNQDAWERDVLASYKVRYFSQPAALDHRFVIQSTGGS